MLKEVLKKFMALAPLRLPKLLGVTMPDDVDTDEDTLYIVFPLEEPFPTTTVMDMLEDDMELSLLYNGKKIESTRTQVCCFFSSPRAGSLMFKINIQSDEQGMSHQLGVTLFDDPQVMEDNLETDLKVHTAELNFIKSMTATDLLNLFCIEI